MAGWSMLADDGLSLSRCKELPKSVEGGQNEVSMGEMRGVGGNRSLGKPIPPLLGNGKAIDLLKLFVHVKNRGGYDAVSREGLWEKVGEDQGLSCSGLGSAIKLVYHKYFQTLDKDLMNISGAVDFDGGAVDFIGLKADLKVFASTVFDGGKKNDAMSEEGSTDGDKLGGVKMDSTMENVEAVDNDCASSGLSGNQKPSAGQEAVFGVSFVAKEGSSQKRKRGSLTRMLHWMSSVAQDPTNPVIGLLPESSKWSYYANDHCWKQVLLARKALFLKHPEGVSPEQYDLQKKQKMHPSMFDDSSVSAERVRSSRRLLYGSPNESSSFFQKRIPVGQFFQAEVPEWTGMAAGSDSKWLGTRVWSPEETRPVSQLNHFPCGCQFPGSTVCVKRHISQSRMKLQVELGSVFYQWKFDKMGEEAAVSWTVKEEQKFEAVVKENPLSLGKYFWEELPKSLPSKSREELVSYYFNVFLLRRRGHQNRYQPSDIDSDDDETEFIAKSNSLILTPAKKTSGR